MPGSGMLLHQIPKNMEQPWNWAVGGSWKNFEKHDRESLDSLRLLVRIWALMVLPVRTRKEMRNTLLEIKKATPEIDL